MCWHGEDQVVSRDCFRGSARTQFNFKFNRGGHALAADSAHGNFGAKSGAKFAGKSSYEGFVSIAKALKSGAFLRTGLGLGGSCGAKHAADDATGGELGFVKFGERGPEAEFFRVACVDAGNKRADEFVEKLCGKPAADEVGDGFVGIGRPAVPEEIAEDASFCASAEEGGDEKCERTERGWP